MSFDLEFLKKIKCKSDFRSSQEDLIKCHELRSLTPSVNEFEKRIKIAIDNKIPPIKIGNIRNNYPQWYYCFNQLNIL